MVPRISAGILQTSRFRLSERFLLKGSRLLLRTVRDWPAWAQRLRKLVQRDDSAPFFSSSARGAPTTDDFGSALLLLEEGADALHAMPSTLTMTLEMSKLSPMHIVTIGILAIVQGAAELLPVSSSAHVILVEKLFGLDPASPEMTFLLVMLHTGTTIAVLFYFWSRWGKLLSKSNRNRGAFVEMLVVATVITGIVGLALQAALVQIFLGGQRGAVVENLFGNVWIIASALSVVGILIIVAGFAQRNPQQVSSEAPSKAWSEGWKVRTSLVVGAIQGLALPFRGFSRSGSTISAGLIGGMERRFAEEFSFALAVILTIPVVAREALRLRHAVLGAEQGPLQLPVLAGVIGMVLSFGAGLAAIRWLSTWLEKGKWGFFGIYCLVLSTVLFILKSTQVLA